MSTALTSAPATAPRRPAVTLPASLASMLDRVRARFLAVQIAEFPVLLAGGLAVVWLLQGIADRVFELPWIARAIMLGIDVAGALVLLVIFGIAPLMRRMDRARAALLVERKLPQFRTSLISAVELSAPNAEYPPQSQSLVIKLLDDVSREAAKEDVPRQVVRTDRLKQYLKWAAAALVLAVGCFVYFQPVSLILVKRILLSEVPFPADTEVIALTTDMTVDAGSNTTLKAQAKGVIPAEGRLLITTEGSAPETIALTPTPHEPGVFTYMVKNVRAPFRYHFELNDGIGAEHKVNVQVPPSLKELRFVQKYPAYTGLPEANMSPASLRLVEGSTLHIEGTASEALQSALMEFKGQPEPLPLPIVGDARTSVKAELKVPASGWKNLSIHLMSVAGEASINDPVYRIDIINDRPPAVSLMLPKKEAITLLANAKVPVAFKISDDFGLKRASLSYQIFRPGLGSAQEAAENGELPIALAKGERNISRTMEWDLGRLLPAVTIGCTIRYWIEAQDNNGVKEPATTRSTEKTIAIVSEEQKRLELLDLLGERAKDIERLYELQRGMNEKTDSSLR